MDNNVARLADAYVRPLLERLAPIPVDEWRHFARHLRLLQIARGEALTRAGEPARSFGLVLAGVIRKAYVTATGRSMARAFSGPGELVGAYASLLSGNASHLTVDALVDSTLFVMPWSAFVALYDRHVCWQIVGRRVAETELLDRESRADELLTQSPTERYEAFCVRHAPLLPFLHQYDIASYLGITPVSLSRLRGRRRRRPSAG